MRLQRLEEEMHQLQESAVLFEVVIPEFKYMKACRKELRMLKVTCNGHIHINMKETKQNSKLEDFCHESKTLFSHPSNCGITFAWLGLVLTTGRPHLGGRLMLRIWTSSAKSLPKTLDVRHSNQIILAHKLFYCFAL